MSRFDYIQYDQLSQDEQSSFKQSFVSLESVILKKIKSASTGLEQEYWEHSLKALEVSYAWIGKAIKTNQSTRNGPGKTYKQEARVNS